MLSAQNGRTEIAEKPEKPTKGAAFDLSYLLSLNGIPTTGGRVLVMRHAPHERELRRVFPWLAVEKPALFNAYQETQPARVEKQLAGATHLVSCIGHRPRQALFIGVYRVIGQRPISLDEFWSVRENQELRRLGMRGWDSERPRPLPIMWTDMLPEPDFDEWKGKLVLEWPSPEISWVRWAAQNTFPIKAILEDSILDRGMPEWERLVLTWAELQNIPKRWVAALEQWRGVYLIHDVSDGKGYVGSAYGHRNLYGRWMNYSATGDGGNKLLRDPRRKPENFRFSILQRLSPDMEEKDVVTVENSWKDRLHTREYGLNMN